MATFGERLKAAMTRKGIATTPDSMPGARLRKMWIAAYGEHDKKHPDYISRQSPHNWLNSQEVIADINPHSLMRLADLLGVSSRWLLRGSSFGHVNMEPVIGLTAEELALLDGFRQLRAENKIRLQERLKSLQDEQDGNPVNHAQRV
jgi:hypothetical protein